jgi:23S rRNA (adenine2030-N6)-methyltransferase
MNYRHAFHAGGFVDVVKHLILTRIILYFQRKAAAFRVIDTHAGRGRYDLTSREAERSPEWREGIARVMAKGLPELAAPYLEAIRAFNPDGLATYPGSPVLTRHLLRPQDRLEAVDLHPEDAATLKEEFAGDVQTRVIELDGWLALGAHLPPKEKRGIVLVDPPFEEPGEWDRLVEGLVKAHKRFATGTYALWYPLKEPSEVEGFVRALRDTGIPDILRIELTIRKASTPARLFGTGMIVVNPPYVLEEEMRALLPALAAVLADESRGGTRIEWIRGEVSKGSR